MTTMNATGGGAGGVREIDAPTLKGWLDAGQAVLVDVREPDENLRERIPGATLLPLSRWDASAVPSNGAKVVLHCRTGQRAAHAAQRLRAAGRPPTDVFSLKGGIQAWRAAGMKVEESRVPIGIMRQVQITAGTTVLVGSVLAWLVSPWFLVLTGFFGAGLLFAGASGTCGMAAMLAYMPWNRVFRGGGAAACAPGNESPAGTSLPG